MTDQTWCADGYAKHARYVSDLAMPVVELLDARPGERILDLGCGDGVLTKKLLDSGCDVVGIDSSPDLIRAALRLGLNVSVQNAYEIDFHEEFDAVFSNAVLHWIKDADRVIRNVFRALRAGGRFVAECGGHKCCEMIQTALVMELERRGYDGWTANPWYFPTAQDYGGRLAKAGFRVAYIEIIPRPTPLPGDISGFLETFAGSFTSVLPLADRQSYIEDVRDKLKPVLCGADGTWTADYTRLRFEAYKTR
ncbi:MAG: class I SAM-dependent methyltransferase [Vicinamibacterales bacterium]